MSVTVALTIREPAINRTYRRRNAMTLAVAVVEEHAVERGVCEVCVQIMASNMDSMVRVGICPECQRDLPE